MAHQFPPEVRNKICPVPPKEMIDRIKKKRNEKLKVKRKKKKEESNVQGAGVTVVSPGGRAVQGESIRVASSFSQAQGEIIRVASSFSQEEVAVAVFLSDQEQ